MPKPASRKKALVIAVSRYDEGSNLKDLPFCENDGNKMLKVLKNLEYEIKNSDGLVGYVDGTNMQNAIYDFFTDDDIKADDTLLLYFSGHGVPGKDDFFLASSNIEPARPKKKGFSFDDLNGEIAHCHAKRLVIILDSCYAGSASISKGDESAIATAAKNRQSSGFTLGEGRCLLSSCMGFQESFATTDEEHSFFTNYLLKGLEGADGKSTDDNGIVTPESLMNYIDSTIDELPKEKRPRQTPFRKIESAGKIMLAEYPKFRTHNEMRRKGEVVSSIKEIVPKKMQKSLTVGLIRDRVSGKTAAVGVLIGPNIVLTIDGFSNEEISNCTIEFSFENDEDDNEFLAPEICKMDPGEILIRSADLGFVIIATKGLPGRKFGWSTPSETQNDVEDANIYLISYSGRERIVTNRADNVIEKITPRDIIYKTKNPDVIQPGAPVFDTRWNLLGLQVGTIEPNRKVASRIEAVVNEVNRLCNEKNVMACKVLESLKLRPRSFLDVSQG